MEREARDAGHELTREDLVTLRETLAQNIAQLRDAMKLDSALALAVSDEDRNRAVASAVDSYMAAITNDLAQLAIVPPFLAEQLRQDMAWDVSSSGINRALDRGARMRSAVVMPASAPATAEVDSGQGGSR